jgi:TolB-like protein
VTEIFVSYARSTATQAQAVVAALRALGYSVWIDDDLPAHRTFGGVIEEQMAAAKAAVVIWSADAVRSEWVLSEANRAREDRKLVQVTTDRSRLPMPFDTIQCVDLAGWTGEADAPGWRKVLASIRELVTETTPAQRRQVAADPTEPLLAVLAFDNLSGDAEMAYFSDGVSEEILQTVARGAELKVIGRGSSFQFRGRDKAAAHVAAALSATHVLDGSVRRSGNKVRIAANLIECERETTIWSDRFDRELSDVFALQDEIAAAVAAALKVAFADGATWGRRPIGLYALPQGARAQEPGPALPGDGDRGDRAAGRGDAPGAQLRPRLGVPGDHAGRASALRPGRTASDDKARRCRRRGGDGAEARSGAGGRLSGAGSAGAVWPLRRARSFSYESPLGGAQRSDRPHQREPVLRRGRARA